MRRALALAVAFGLGAGAAVPAPALTQTVAGSVRVTVYRPKVFHGMARANVTFVSTGRVDSIVAELHLITVAPNGGVSLQKVQHVTLPLPAQGVTIARFAAVECTTSARRVWKMLAVVRLTAAGQSKGGVVRGPANVIGC